MKLLRIKISAVVMVCFLFACITAALPSAAVASTITYYFDDSIISRVIAPLPGSPAVWPGAPTSLGSISFTDDLTNSRYVDVAVNILSPYKILAFGGNFNAFQTPAPGKAWFFAFDNSIPSGVEIKAAQNGFSADGSGNYGSFDVNIDGNALTSASTSTFTGVLKYEEWNIWVTNGPGGIKAGDLIDRTGNIADLDIGNFMIKDSQNQLYAWVHVGNTPPNGSGSIALGAVERTIVPEPTTMLLLGFGLIGIAGIRRFKK